MPNCWQNIPRNTHKYGHANTYEISNIIWRNNRSSEAHLSTFYGSTDPRLKFLCIRGSLKVKGSKPLKIQVSARIISYLPDCVINKVIYSNLFSQYNLLSQAFLRSNNYLEGFLLEIKGSSKNQRMKYLYVCWGRLYLYAF